ncbi:MAG: DUF3524 domain-containing protein [Planctomycetales bacterium]|nr:DUF3524 domain-containing protein [Planctomycetales bacterium]
MVLEPFGGGSHAAFYGDWARFSRHRFTVLELPAVHWKWRSRHSSLSLAEQAAAASRRGRPFDLVFCSEMLNLAEWRGFAIHDLRDLPAVVYFHENQFTYPLAPGLLRDHHYGYSNILTAIAADQLWFNTEFHRSEFTQAARSWLRRMPDYKHLEKFEAACERSLVRTPGIVPKFFAHDERQHRSPTIGWVARWEHDKAPERFVDAIIALDRQGLDFQLCLLGQRFVQQPECLSRLRDIAGPRILYSGYAESRNEYWQLLASMDLVVSTADHEFFGMAILEAVAAGARPGVPRRLAYPEVFGLEKHPCHAQFFYESTTEALVEWLRREITTETWRMRPVELQQFIERYHWQNLVVGYDDAIAELCSAGRRSS